MRHGVQVSIILGIRDSFMQWFKASPARAVFFFLLGGLIGLIGESYYHHRSPRCATSNVMGQPYTVCEER